MLCSVASNAAWTSKLEISELKATSVGLYIALAGFSNNDPSVNCSSNAFVMREEDSNYQVRASFLLSAYMSSTPVNISYAECDQNGFTKVSSVMLK